MRAEMEKALQPTEGGWRILASAADDPVTADIITLFGRRVGDLVPTTGGLNELASALVMAIQLGKALDRHQRLAVAACIEQTSTHLVNRGAACETHLANRIRAECCGRSTDDDCKHRNGRFHRLPVWFRCLPDARGRDVRVTAQP